MMTNYCILNDVEKFSGNPSTNMFYSLYISEYTAYIGVITFAINVHDMYVCTLL